MKLLLDTQIFLWYISADKRLPVAIQQNIQLASNEVYLSVVSVWETIIKYQLGKLPLSQPAEVYLPMQRKRHLIANLNIDEACTVRLATLPALHRDPFDRMLICQAIEHNLTIATVDHAIITYPVKTLSN
ncbi:MAG: type II toxin-antitoxin system VapC family toxin [Caldilineaceae bacterium]